MGTSVSSRSVFHRIVDFTKKSFPYQAKLFCVVLNVTGECNNVETVTTTNFGLYRLVSFAFLVISFETRKAHSKQERNDQVFKE